MFRLMLVSFALSIGVIIGQEELKCKAREGCHFSGCDPARSSPDILDRNEFPITCKQTGRGGSEAGVTSQSYQLLLNSHLANTHKITTLTGEVKELSETSTLCLQRLDNVEKENRDLKTELNELKAEWRSLGDQLRKDINQLKEGNDEMLPIISSPAPQTTRRTTMPDLTTRLISTGVTCGQKGLKNSLQYNTTFCPAGKPVGSFCSISCKGDFRFFPYAREWNAACKLQAGNNLKAEWELDAVPRCGMKLGLGLEKSSPKDRAVIWTPRFAPGSYCVRFRVFAILTDKEDDFVVRMWEYVHSKGSGNGRPLLWKKTFTALKNNTWTSLEFDSRNLYVDIFMQLQFYWPYLGNRSSVILDDLSVEKGKCKS